MSWRTVSGGSWCWAWKPRGGPTRSTSPALPAASSFPPPPSAGRRRREKSPLCWTERGWAPSPSPRAWGAPEGAGGEWAEWAGRGQGRPVSGNRRRPVPGNTEACPVGFRTARPAHARKKKRKTVKRGTLRAGWRRGSAVACPPGAPHPPPSPPSLLYGPPPVTPHPRRPLRPAAPPMPPPSCLARLPARACPHRAAHPHQFRCLRPTLWRASLPSRGARPCSAPATTTPPSPPPPDATAAQFASLAAALADPTTLSVAAGPTPLGRGLLATRPAAPGATLLSVDVCCALGVATHAPAAPGGFARSALADWQAVHGPLPPLLVRYVLAGSDNWFARLVAWQAWATACGPPAWRAYGVLMPQVGWSAEGGGGWSGRPARSVFAGGLAVRGARASLPLPRRPPDFPPISLLPFSSTTCPSSCASPRPKHPPSSLPTWPPWPPPSGPPC